MICIDQLGLGFNALTDGKLLDKHNNVIPGLYTIGNGLNGILFESTAIPEIRLQAYNLAKELIQQNVEKIS